MTMGYVDDDDRLRDDAMSCAMYVDDGCGDVGVVRRCDVTMVTGVGAGYGAGDGV